MKWMVCEVDVCELDGVRVEWCASWMVCELDGV